MKPDWDKLMGEFKDNDKILVADVDCTAAGEKLCSTHDVKGYPTIKHGDPTALEDYKGARSFDALKKFAEGLKPKCSPFNLELCEGEEKTKITEMMEMSPSSLDEKIKESEKKIADAEEKFKTELDKLQKNYESYSKEKDDKMKEIKDSGLGLMKAVKAKLDKDGKAGRSEL